MKKFEPKYKPTDFGEIYGVGEIDRRNLTASIKSHTLVHCAKAEEFGYERRRADEAKEREAEIKFTPEEIKLVIHACKFIAGATTDYTARWEQLAKRISELQKETTK
jgi:hypothetical protein